MPVITPVRLPSDALVLSLRVRGVVFSYRTVLIRVKSWHVSGVDGGAHTSSSGTHMIQQARENIKIENPRLSVDNYAVFRVIFRLFLLVCACASVAFFVAIATAIALRPRFFRAPREASVPR